MALAAGGPRPTTTLRVLVAHAYFRALDVKQALKARPYPPLATLYVASGLRDAGHDVSFFDAMLAPDESAFAEPLAARPDVVVLYEDNFNFLTKMCLTRMREAATTMIAAAAATGAAVVVSGSDATDHPELYLDAGADFVAVGEGDHTVAELVAWLADGHDRRTRPVPVDGVVLRMPLEAPVEIDVPPVAHEPALPPALGVPVAIGRTPRRAVERHPEVFSPPARDLVDIEAYREIWTRAHGTFSLNMVSTRGCPFHCNWCAKPIWGQRYAMREAVAVARELAHVAHTYRPDHVWFADDIFGLRSSWVRDFADELHRLDVRVPFSMQSRADLMSEPAVAALADAGCHEVWMGAESGSQRILDAMDKGIRVDEIRVARDRLGAAGIRACFFIQFGYPGEEWADIEATIDLVRTTLPDDVGISVSYPLPGTRFHSLVAAELTGKENWEQSNDLAMIFRGTYTTDFYRALHLALHDDLDLRRREAGLPGAPHASLARLDLGGQRQRVGAAWADVHEREPVCRNAERTVIGLPEMSPAPDLRHTFG